MKKSIKHFTLILSALLLGALIGVSCYFVKNKLTAKILNNDVKQIVDAINEVNSFLVNDNLSATDVFTIKKDYVCKKYVGNNLENLKNKIDVLYENPYDHGFIYENNELYICIPNSCINIVEIKNYNIINNDDAKILEVKNENSNYSFELIKKDKHWKLEYPIINCE